MGWLETERSIMRIGMKEIFVYRFSMLISLITGPIFFLISYIVWNSVFATTGRTELGGFTLEQLVTYYAISIVGFYLIWDHTDQLLLEGVHEGKLIRFLIKPLSFIKYSFLNKIGHRFVAFFLEFIPVLLILGFFFGFQMFNKPSAFYFIILISLSFIIFFELNVIFGSLAFWFVKPHGIFWAYRMLLMVASGFLIPLTFFPLWAQKILFLLPFQYVRFVPAQVFSGGYSLGGIEYSAQSVILMACANVVVLGIIMVLFWNISIKKFCGVGT